MAGFINWASGPQVSGFGLQASGTGLQITNGTAMLCSGQYDNTGVSGGPSFFGMAELFFSASGFAAAVAGQSTLDLYLVPAPAHDTTQFAGFGVSGAIPSPNHYKGTFYVTTSGNGQMRLMIELFELAPTTYQAVLKNNTGQTLNSGWCLHLDSFQEAYT